MEIKEIIWRLKNEPEWIILGLLVLFLGIGGGGYYYYQNYNTTREAHSYFNRVFRKYSQAQKPEDYGEVTRQLKQLANQFSGSDVIDEVYFYLGKSYYRQEKYRKAIKTFRRIIKNHPESFFLPAAHLHAGYGYYQLNKDELALHQFEVLAKKLAPNHPLWPEALWQQAQTYRRLDRREKAVELLRKIAERDGEANQYWTHRARGLLAEIKG